MASSKKAPVAEPSKSESVAPAKVAAATTTAAAAKKAVAKKVVAKAVAAPKVVAQAAPAKAAAKAPAAAKPAAGKAVAAAKAKPKAATQKATGVQGPAIDSAQRANYIEVAAYYIAQRRGGAPGNPDQDYLNAAAEVDQLIAAGHFAR